MYILGSIIENIMKLAGKYGEEYVIRNFEQDILNAKKIELSYMFVRNIKGSDKKAHGQVIIDSKDPDYNYYYAKNVEGADIIKHQEVIGDIDCIIVKGMIKNLK